MSFYCCRVVLVDAPLLLASQLREYWRLGQKAGYEVFIGQPLELDDEVPPCSGLSQTATAAEPRPTQLSSHSLANITSLST